MADERSIDEYLGFVRRAAVKDEPKPEPADGLVADDGAYEDSWYQVLKARTGEADEA